MTVHEILLDPAGSVPEVEVMIGGAQFGFYAVYLVGGGSKKKIMSGTSLDRLPRRESLKLPPDELIGQKRLFWLMQIFEMPGDSIPNVEPKLTVFQNNVVRSQSPFESLEGRADFTSA